MEKLFTPPKQAEVLGVRQNFSLESEKVVISAALNELRADVMREVGLQILASDFHEEAHQNLWRCHTTLVDAGAAHDVTAVMDSARKLSLFFGGVEYVVGLATDDALATSSEMAIRAAARRIKDYSISRQLQDSLSTALQLIESGTESHEGVANYVSDTLENIRAMNTLRASGPTHVMDYVSSAIEQVEQLLDGKAPTSSVSTGYKSIDQMIMGLTDGDLVILAGRPSMGKTALSLGFAENAALGMFGEESRDVLYFSTEQGGVALARRMIASRGRIDSTSLRNGQLSEGDFARLMEGAQAIGGLSLWIDETSEITLPEIKARARIWASQRKPGRKLLVMVDYLQRIASHRNGDKNVDAKQIISEISTGFKNLAKELKCPLVALAQLNRECEKRTNKRPMLSDLGDSGKIEQDADVVMFMYRDDYYNPDSKEPGTVEVIVAKNREGAVGVARLGFEKRTQKFTEGYTHD